MVFGMVLKDSAESINLQQEKAFIGDFLNIWSNIRVLMHSEQHKYQLWRNWGDLAEKIFLEFTLPFYQKWKHLDYIQFVESYATRFHSVLFHMDGINVLIPRKLIIYEANTREGEIYEQLQNKPSLENFRKVIFQLTRDYNFSLRKTDVKIIQKLANPNFSKSLDKFPKLKELAYGTRQDVRTVTSRLDFLLECSLLSMFYSLDMAKIGYQTVVFLHETTLQEIPEEVLEYVFYNFPAPPLQKHVAVVQYPYANSEIISSLESTFGISPGAFTIPTKQYRNWNLAGLTAKPEERWKLRPPLLRPGGSWKRELIVGNIGFEYNLDPDYDYYQVSRQEAELLGYIYQYSTMDYKALETQLKRSRKSINVDWTNLLRNKIINRFPTFSHIGLGSWVYFLIYDLPSDDVQRILQHFKFFPFSNVFYNDKKGLMVGIVNIPLSWTHTLLYRFASLYTEVPGVKISYYIGPDVIVRWSMNIRKTFDWKRFD
ncbi:hypothetical protein CEE45_10175 [Candidatus Heimdallarchaeota archaeon B3_Heim]|nr:MAG: hypothetical protein CEE45_10175 [Candidatus Heimdallarchaeota archaeon B3_Heim]